MAVTPSQMLELGTTAPAFSLPDINNKQVSLDSFGNKKALLIVFMCNHCPYVIHIRNKLVEVLDVYQKRGVAIVAINANDADNYPEDSFKKMGEYAKTYNYTFPYLYDETQKVAQSYRAACTPDFFLFNNKKELVYRGQFDDSRPGNDKPVTGADLCAAMDSLLEDKQVSQQQKASIGCNIKWKPGNEPTYF